MSLDNYQAYLDKCQSVIAVVIIDLLRGI
uniref:Transcriptional regulator n=1 Tax=Heterorhabditis bacteriophora TaxID=37862 RepID=A0A1I7WSG8_HETBA